MSNNFTYKTHIENTVKAAKRMSGWILRTFHTRDPSHLLPLWKSLVLSRLEYLCQLWSPHKLEEIKDLEQAQRVFTRKLQAPGNYWERLKFLGMYSLQRRRERYIIIYVWKILEDLVPNPMSPADGGIKAQHHQRFGRTCYRKSVEAATQRLKSIVATSFLYEGPRLFNCLPRDIRDMTKCSTDAFKSRLDKYLHCIPDEPPILHTVIPRGATTNSLPDQVRHMVIYTSTRYK